MNNVNIDYIGDDLAKAYSEGYEQGKFDMMQHTRGEWTKFNENDDSYICSLCGYVEFDWKNKPHNFCPNCGSKNRRNENEP